MLDKLCRDPTHLERLLEAKLGEEKDLKIFDWLKFVSTLSFNLPQIMGYQ